MADPEREESLRTLVARDRGDSAFAELADLEMARGEHHQALLTLLGGLSANPSHQVGRLILARLFLHLDFTPFAIRELKELRAATPACESLKRLIEAIAPGTLAAEQLALGSKDPVTAEVAALAPASSREEVVAEDEFEFDILESLEEKK
jgi:hypothetical protein